MSPNLIGLRAGETPGQRSTAGGQRGGEGGSAVGQEGLQVAEPSVKAWSRFIKTDVSNQ